MALPSSAAAFVSIIGFLATGFFSSVGATSEQASSLGFNLTGDPAQDRISLGYEVLLVPEKAYQAAGGTADGVASDKANDLLASKCSQEFSTPSVTTQEGLKTTVEVTRDFPYATGSGQEKPVNLDGSDIRTRKIGIHIMCLPTYTADKRSAELELECDITNFEGWLTTSSGAKRPIFNTRRIKTQRLASFDKPTFVWFANPVPNGATAKQDPDASLLREGLMITVRRAGLAAR